MEHFIIFSYMVSLMIGAYAVFYTNQLYKLYTFPFLKTYVVFIIFFNLMLLVNLTSLYIFTNLVEYDPSNLHPLFVVIGYPLGLFIIVVMVYSFIRTIMELQETDISTQLRRWFTGVVIILTICYVIGITLYFQTASTRWLTTTNSWLNLFSFLSIYTVLFDLLLQRRLRHKPNRQKAINAFAYLNLTVDSLLFVFLFLHHPFVLYLVFVWLPVLNLCPLIWFKFFFLNHYSDAQSLLDDQSVLDQISIQHRISKREQEIMHLIVLGKSNKEIEDMLFISFNTVKNHIYNLYQKLGVKSRGQLVHLILKRQKKGFLKGIGTTIKREKDRV